MHVYSEESFEVEEELTALFLSLGGTKCVSIMFIKLYMYVQCFYMLFIKI